MRLKDKAAIVTGGAQGIGESICIRLAGEGARVAIFDIDIESARDTVRAIEKAGGEALALEVDVSSSVGVDAAINDVIERFGTVDILVNNAGMSRSAEIDGMEEELWQRTQDINLKGVFLCCRAVIPHMKERRCGKIVNISSILGISGSPAMAHYGAAKAGVIGFTSSLAIELGPYNINVNAVGPAVIQTRMLEQETTPSFRERLEKKIPLRRIGDPRDIANAVLFLASDEASYITGQCLFVCGGFTASAGFL